MGRRWLRRIALTAGALALAVQFWAAKLFVQTFISSWHATRPELVSFAESVNRFSQLKTPALKYPTAAVYFVLAAAGILAILGWLVYRGVIEAIAPAPEVSVSKIEGQEKAPTARP